MSFTITDLQRDPSDRVYVKVYDNEGGSMNAGNRIQVRADFGSGIEIILDEVVPAGKSWNGIHFQFQAVEDST